MAASLPVHPIVDKLVTCSICLDWFKSPRRLPNCLHVFCLECLRKLVYRQYQITCPECRTVSKIPRNGVDGLHQDSRIHSFVDDLTRIRDKRYCEECKNVEDVNDSLTICRHCDAHLCDQCKCSHHKLLQSDVFEQFQQFHRKMPTEKLLLQIRANGDLWEECQKKINLIRNRVNKVINEAIQELEKKRTELLRELNESWEKSQTRMKWIKDIFGLKDTITVNNSLLTAKDDDSLIKLHQNLVENNRILSDSQSDKWNNVLDITFDFDTNAMKSQISNLCIKTRNVYTYHCGIVIGRSSLREQCDGPCDVAVCPKTGNIYISESNFVHTYNADWKHVSMRQCKTLENDSSPLYLTVDEFGNIFVCDTTGVAKFNDDWKRLWYSKFDNIVGIACKKQCLYAVTCNGQVHCISISDGESSEVSRIGHPINYNSFITINERNEFLVLNSDYKRVNSIKSYSYNGDLITEFGHENSVKLFLPRGICEDNDGQILVGNNSDIPAIEVYTADGQHKGTIACPGTRTFNFINSLAVTAKGEIVAVDVGRTEVIVLRTSC